MQDFSILFDFLFKKERAQKIPIKNRNLSLSGKRGSITNKKISRFPHQPRNRPSRGWRSSASCTAGRGCSQPPRPWCSRALAP